MELEFKYKFIRLMNSLGRKIINDIQLTKTADPDSSRLERKAWVRKGLDFSGPVESSAHKSQSVDETSKIDDATDSDILRGFRAADERSYINCIN